MTKLTVNNTISFSGIATPPSSKSHSIRGLMFALLSKNTSTLHNILISDDTDAAIRVCRELGAHIQQNQESLMIDSASPLTLPKHTTLYTGNSGITTHFMMPILGLRDQVEYPIILDCGDQMRARSIHSFVDSLNQLGMHIHYLNHHGELPISITGKLKGGKTIVDGSTSQYLSALLIALPLAQCDSELRVKHLHERPYIDMTLDWLREQHIDYRHEQSYPYDIFYIKGQQQYHGFKKTIPGDFSSASYLIAAAVLLPGCVTLNGLNMTDSQGDKRLISILQEMGANISIQDHSLIIHGDEPLKGIAIDANDIPDLLPTLAVIGTKAQGKTTLYNVPHARSKETDRIHSMSEGLTRLGAQISEQPDSMIIHHSSLTGTLVEGYNDHRTVMALSIAGMLAEDKTTISDANAIQKTFPTFVSLMQSLGARMELSYE